MRIGFSVHPLKPHPGKTLAVMSCALALLAAHPLSGRGAAAETPAAVRTVGEAARPVVTLAVRVEERAKFTGGRVMCAAASRAPEDRRPRGETGLIACLTQFLLMHVAPVAAPQLLPALVQTALGEPVVLVRQAAEGIVYPDLPPPCETRFAITRHLLAPPS